MEIRAHFEAEQFGAELVELLKAWQAEWCFPDSGPTTCKSPGEYAAFGGTAKWHAETKERQAYQNLLNYAATAITVANQHEEGELVLQALRRYWGNFAGGSHSDPDYIRFSHDVFARTLQIVRQRVNTGQDKNIVGLMEYQRERVGKTLGFGYLIEEPKTEESGGKFSSYNTHFAASRPAGRSAHILAC